MESTADETLKNRIRQWHNLLSHASKGLEKPLAICLEKAGTSETEDLRLSDRQLNGSISND